MPKLDIANQRYGRLVAIEPTEERSGSRVKWLFKCDCGNTKVISVSSVRAGNTKSCGCLQKERIIKLNKSYERAIDVTGQRYGRLVAIEPTEERSGGSIKWLFKCDCGNEKIISLNSVRAGNTKSCGCLQKEIAKLPTNKT